MLDETLVIFGGEFGRTPMMQGKSGEGKMTKAGRDHHIDGFTKLMIGGPLKRGYAFGQTDEFGFNIVENPVHIHDFHATVLHMMGIDHRKLTYRFQGRDYRLTDIGGRIVTGPLCLIFYNFLKGKKLSLHMSLLIYPRSTKNLPEGRQAFFAKSEVERYLNWSINPF